ncbi:MAG TPA: glutamyl-tRNA reductase [Kineosporiaceae bacterium]|nr:glutamyl-tRNA reductase [Kineosporiaceae bacterium]
MSVLVVGLSYRTAPIGVLERAALDAAACRSLESGLCLGEHVAEAVVLSTCNRLEIYADVSKFHAGVAEVSQGLADATGVGLSELTDHLYVHYEGAAVAHLFSVACGLDSMAVGEQQILGQVRRALKEGSDGGSVGRALSQLLQQALRVGKRAHSETELDRAGHSLVEAGLAVATGVIGPLPQAHALVVGAGAMSGLAVATLARAGVGILTVVNRTPQRARRLAESAGGRARDLTELPEALAEADLVISCTGAVGHVITAPAAATAMAARSGRPQVYVDLALPRDVDPAVCAVDGVVVADLEHLGRQLATESVAAQLDEVRDLVAEEVDGYLAAQRAEAVAPTVVALRALAGSVVEVELARLSSRLGDVDERVRAEVRQAVHRVVEKLLHTPTVRVKELAGEPGGSSYAEALRELFGLDPERIAAVSRTPSQPVPNGDPRAVGAQPAPPSDRAGLVTGARGGQA